MTTAGADGTIRWRHSDAVAHVESPGRVALVSLSDLAAPPMLLTDSAAFIWGLVDGLRDVAAIVSACADEFGVDDHDIQGDVTAYLSDLAARRLIVATE